MLVVTLSSYQGFRYPVEVIAHAVWLYFRFPLSFREVEELLLERGITVSYETVRQWTRKFGQTYADGLRRRRPRPGDKWLYLLPGPTAAVRRVVGPGGAGCG
ncbi:transposase-like protein [Streptomyces sp. V4I8]